MVYKNIASNHKICFKEKSSEKTENQINWEGNYIKSIFSKQNMVATQYNSVTEHCKLLVPEFFNIL